ncbi:MAG: helix-turn-helix domain-containing protein [Sphingobacterium sp.]|uniref:helix-turn-helix domain-containing protein n=1 Tax=Sphingobacterium sp. JB170 TaxID=1434842 RepID=UPI000B35C7BB|nr:helix-turn-helix transcriptional regulator [Sphingobacterium sp. JB170]
MPIRIRLDDIMSKNKVSLNELSQKVGITLSNLSIIKNEKSKAIRLSTLDALCRALNCQPGDIIEYVEEDN